AVEVVVRDQGDHRLPARAAVHGQPLHVVDLVTEIRPQQDLPGQSGAGPDAIGRQTPDAHVDALRPAEITLQDQEPSVRQTGNVGDVEAVEVAQLQGPRQTVHPDPAAVIATASGI